MTSIDINDPKIFQKVREKLKLQLGKDLSDKEILKRCLMFSMEHLEELFPGEREESEYEKNVLNESGEKEKPILEFVSGILEDEVEKIKQSGKTIKQVIRESWKYWLS